MTSRYLDHVYQCLDGDNVSPFYGTAVTCQQLICVQAGMHSEYILDCNVAPHHWSMDYSHTKFTRETKCTGIQNRGYRTPRDTGKKNSISIIIGKWKWHTGNDN